MEKVIKGFPVEERHGHTSLEKEGVAEAMIDELTITPISLCCWGGQETENQEGNYVQEGGKDGGKMFFEIWFDSSFSYSDLIAINSVTLPKMSQFFPWQ